MAEVCGRGHPWDEYSAYRPGRRGRVCLGCERERARRYRARAAETVPVRQPQLREETLRRAEETARLTRAGRTAQQIAWHLGGVSTRAVVRYRALARSMGWLPPCR